MFHVKHLLGTYQQFIAQNGKVLRGLFRFIRVNHLPEISYAK